MPSKNGVPTRREIRASVFAALATTLHSDYSGTGAGYLYDCDESMTDAQRAVYYDRVSAECAEIVEELDARARRLGWQESEMTDAPNRLAG